ncbi:MAG TPA: methyltransferase domain-containing protein [Gammaproteobacteria bacterium]|nr:methyltransferase domain-containing protein [Gammaproteobacteria bacterium]
MKSIYSAFTGNIPENYDRYLGPMFFHDCARDLAARLAQEPPRHLLEIAAGTGIVTRHLRDHLPATSRIVATDLNDDMLRHARTRFAEDENIEFRAADALALPFEDDCFDGLVCQFGIMFFPDKVQGLREMRRVLKPGGRLFFSVWDALEHNPLPRHTNAMLDGLFEGKPPAFLHTPFSYHDQDQIRRDMRAAGFAEAEFSTLQGECRFPEPRHAALGMITGSPLRLEIEQLGHVTIDEAVEEVAAGLERRFGAGDCCVPMRWTVISSRHS